MSSSTKTGSQGVTHIVAAADDEGQRIDNYLLRRYKGVPKSHIYRILRRGEVRVNKKRVKPEYKLVAGDQMRLPPMRYSAKGPRRPPDDVIHRVESRVVYEDDRIMVLNKPSGLPVHAGSGIDYGVIDALQAMESCDSDVYLVHRLDRETSGCLLVARDRPAMLYLNQAIRRGEVRKFYQALIKGRWGQGRQVIDMPLERNKTQGGERLSQVDDDGKKAVSVFSPIREFNTASLMKVEILTGRTHQIRAHAAALGHPLAGDRQYGDPAFNLEMKAFGLKRMFLHAQSLEFPHPDDGKTMVIEPPLDDDLQAVLEQMDS